ncbi:hypothetical protein KC957_00090 [Candidatus Saccharibacteria bacterium]|nr:hypothetical protein [Candidatus Saccharibacteria bacterium]
MTTPESAGHEVVVASDVPVHAVQLGSLAVAKIGTPTTELARITREEASIATDLMPADYGEIVPGAPEESLVIVPAVQNLDRRPNGGVGSIFVSYHGRILVGAPRDKDGHWGGIVNYDYTEDGRHVASSVTPTDVWATSLEELDAGVAQRKRLDELERQFYEQHPLGDGAVYITNRYGGIDPTRPVETLQSLMSRFRLVKELELDKNPEHYVAHGLFNAQTAALVGDELVELVTQLEPSMQVYEQMAAAGTDIEQLTKMLETLVGQFVTEFMGRTGDKLLLAAQLLKDRAMTDTVIRAVGETDKALAGILKRGAAEQFRVR